MQSAHKSLLDLVPGFPAAQFLYKFQGEVHRRARAPGGDHPVVADHAFELHVDPGQIHLVQYPRIACCAASVEQARVRKHLGGGADRRNVSALLMVTLEQFMNAGIGIEAIGSDAARQNHHIECLIHHLIEAGVGHQGDASGGIDRPGLQAGGDDLDAGAGQ